MLSSRTVAGTCAGLALACLPMAAQATVRYVDASASGANNGSSWTDAYRELQSALAVAVSGDEIWVAAGTYKPDYNVGSGTHTGSRTATFQLKSGVGIYGGFSTGGGLWQDRNPAANQTILTGDLAGNDRPDWPGSNYENSYHVVTGSGTDATAIIDGFTIRAGNANGSSPHNCGAGIYNDHGSPTLTSNTVTANSAVAGGGVFCTSSSSPTIANNTITSNSADSGGGIFCTSSSSPTIANNTIKNNSADFSGGAIHCAGSSSPTIANNTITSNSATLTHGFGGGIVCDHSSPTIANNTIRGNSAYEYGGGIYCDSSSPTIANNTITANNASSGGGIFCDYGSPTIANNTITGNSAAIGGGVYCLYSSSPTIANTIVAFNSSGIYGGSPVLRYNCVYGNTAYNYSGMTDPTGTNGNISVDPKPAAVEYGNVHIQPDSPCRDAGNNGDAYGEFDMDGQGRIQPGGGTVDIGADESDGTVWPAGPYLIVRVRPDGDDDNDGSSWELAKRTVQAAIDAATAQGGEVWVQAGTYYERIVLRAYAYLYGGFAGTETERDQRDWTTNVSTLDGQHAGSVVTARAGHAVSTIDGLRITNGSEYMGGGIACDSCSPTIANNTIMTNSAGCGGGIYCFSSSPTLVNNTIKNNSADFSGGGLWLHVASPTIANNTITGNSADSGGGICCYFWSSPTIVNTIVAFNSSGIYRQSGTGSPVLRYNCVYGNTAYNYSGITNPTGSNGNISMNPRFADKDGGDYRLAGGSPCIDAGRNADVPADAPDLDGDGDTTEPMPLDIEGKPRFVDDPATPDCQWAPGTCGDTPIVDMGAYELFALQVGAWRSVRDHGPVAGELPIAFDAAGSGAGVGCETRRFGMQRMEVDFNGDVSGLLTGTVVAEDLTHGGTIAPTGQYTINGGTTLVIEFVFTNLPPLPEIAGLPDAACYRIDLAGHIAGLCGDMDCEFRVLAGDINGMAPPYGDGKTDLTDMATAKANAASGTPLTEDTCLFDVNVDGKIDLTDMALIKVLALAGGAVTCPLGSEQSVFSCQ